jgi:hypothetical protein
MAILPSPANGGQDSVDLLQVGAAMDFEGSRIHPEIVALNFRTVSGANIYEYLAIGCTKRRNDGRLPDFTAIVRAGDGGVVAWTW